MSGAEILRMHTPPERRPWTKEGALELERKGWKSITGVHAFWSNKVSVNPNDVSKAINAATLPNTEVIILERTNMASSVLYSYRSQLLIADALLPLLQGAQKKKKFDAAVALIQERLKESGS